MNTIKIVNIKCEGCKNTIISTLEKNGISNVEVDLEKQEVSFEGDVNIAKEQLAKIGYPEAGSIEAKSLIKKAKSFVSCAIGKMK